MDKHSLDTLIKACDSLTIPVLELESALEVSKLELVAFCDQFARRVAYRFMSGSLEYSDADAAINNLVAFAFAPPEREPGPYTWSIYHAFDAGEYCHPGDAPGVDPVERYTRPKITRIMSSASTDGA